MAVGAEVAVGSMMGSSAGGSVLIGDEAPELQAARTPAIITRVQSNGIRPRCQLEIFTLAPSKSGPYSIARL